MPILNYTTKVDVFTTLSEIQRVVAIEELSELQKELCKSLRSGADRPHIAEEIADVQIMLEQMMMLYECHEDVAIWRSKKVERLYERLIRDGGMRGAECQEPMN